VTHSGIFNDGVSQGDRSGLLLHRGISITERNTLPEVLPEKGHKAAKLLILPDMDQLVGYEVAHPKRVSA